MRLNNPDDQNLVVEAILSKGLNSKEIQQVIQLKIRSGRGVKKCIEEVLDMRPVVEKRHVFIGTIEDQYVESILTELTQVERDTVLQSGIVAT